MRSNFTKDKSLLVPRCQSDELEKAHLLAPGGRYKDGDGSTARNSEEQAVISGVINRTD